MSTVILEVLELNWVETDKYLLKRVGYIHSLHDGVAAISSGHLQVRVYTGCGRKRKDGQYLE